MIDLQAVKPQDLNQMFTLLQQEFATRHWQATIPYLGSRHCFITKQDGRRLHIYGATPPTTSYAAAHLADDKFATYQALSGTAIPQPETVLMPANRIDSDGVSDLFKKYDQLVVKPLDSAHGRGVTVGCKTVAEVQAAASLATGGSNSKQKVLIQAQYEAPTPMDIRIVCINYQYRAALIRKPASVIGDGVHTVRELITAENTKSDRGEAYHARLAVIDAVKAERFLKAEIDEVPPKDQTVAVLGIANYGAGGETIDVTDAIPKWLQKYAEEASRTCSLPVAGVDFMLSKLPESADKEADLRPVFIEINKCPALAMHDMPTHGKPQNVVKKYCDYLATL